MKPREKFIQRGIDSLTNQDLVSILLSTGSKSFDVYKTSKKVLRLLKKEISFEQLKNIHGVGDVKAMRLLVSIELGRRLYEDKKEREVVATSEDAYKLVKYLENKKQEYVVGLFLNARYELLDIKTLSIGTVNNTNIVPRDVLIPALELNSACIILAHNHPSGNSEASMEDIIATKKIKEACDLVGIALLEHIVIGRDGWSQVGL